MVTICRSDKNTRYLGPKRKARQLVLTSLFWFEPGCESGVSGGGGDRTRVVLVAKNSNNNGLGFMDLDSAANALHLGDADCPGLTPFVIDDVDLLKVISRWESLPEAIKLAILKLSQD